MIRNIRFAPMCVLLQHLISRVSNNQELSVNNILPHPIPLNVHRKFLGKNIYFRKEIRFLRGKRSQEFL